MIEELEEDIKFSLESFEFIDMHINSLNFLKIMGFESQRRHEYVNHLPSEFLKQFDSNSVLNKLNAHYKSWKEIGLIFQYSASEMKAMNNSFPLDLSNFSTQSILFFFINLKDFPVTKKDLNEISFEVNKIFRIPCFIIFKYCNYLAISITEKRLNKNKLDKDVIEGIHIIKDINYMNVQKENLKYLKKLSLYNILTKTEISNFDMLIYIWKSLINELNLKNIKDIDSLLERGKFSLEKGKYKYAIELFTDIIETDPSQHIAFEYRATSFYYLQDFENALDDCEYVLSQDPYNSNMNKLLGLLEIDNSEEN